MSYKYLEQVHNFKAPRVVIPLLLNIVNPKSVLDVGCGTGNWLRVFEEFGVSDVLGVDFLVKESDLVISRSQFINQDLTSPLDLGRRFDLVMSLEVAEHLHPESADQFVANLVRHADTILFSAAIPGQGGQFHLNEQWPEYWEQKFNKHGFYFHDVIRPLIWGNKEVEVWYRQNIFVISKEENHGKATGIVHPELFEEKLSGLQRELSNTTSGLIGMKASLGILLRSFIHFFDKFKG
jgi:SAM-dependent methyltransferase